MTKRLPDFQDCIALERFTGGDYCAAKHLLAYAASPSGQLWLQDLTTGETRRLAAELPGSRVIDAPRFAPDGRRLLFQSVTTEKSYQLCIFDLEENRISHSFSFDTPLTDPLWSPDGGQILFGLRHDPMPTQKEDPNAPVVIEDFGYKFDGIGYIRPTGHMHLFLLSPDTGALRQLTDGLSDELQHNWSPDGSRIVYVGNENRSREDSTAYDLYTITLDGEKTQISQDLIMVSYPNPVRPVFTPDGRSVVMGVLNPQADFTKGYPDIVLYQFFVQPGTEPLLLFTASDTCYQCVQFPYNAHCGQGLDKMQIDPEGRFVYFVSGWKGQGNLYRLPLAGQTHTAQTVLAGRQVYNGIGPIQQNTMLVAKSETNMPEAYYLLDLSADTALTKVAQSACDLYETVQLADADDFFFETLDGESQIHGWAMPPQNRVPGQKYPTILYIHGGPHPFYTHGFTMEFQCFAAAGFGIIYCNPRGSSGYGPTHQNAARALDGSAYTDCLQFVSEATARYSWIDPDRLGVTGGSYGGYLTNYIATHSAKFKAFITQRCVANDLIGYGCSDMQGCSKDYPSFEEFMIHSLRSSTVSYAERINKPFLILHGLDDYRTPVEGAHQLFVAIKDTHPDLPVKMVLFPHTHHCQPEDPRLLKLYYEEMLTWFQTYL